MFGSVSEKRTERRQSVDTDAGSWRLALETRPEAEPTMSVTYRVLGNLERIPILSPRLPTDPVQSAVEIRVSGAPRGALADVFPRMTRLANGVLEARPANVPSFVRIPVVGARSFNRWGDLSVLTLLVVGSVWWAIRMRRRSTGVE